jgi:hypothetical protein
MGERIGFCAVVLVVGGCFVTGPQISGGEAETGSTSATSGTALTSDSTTTTGSTTTQSDGTTTEDETDTDAEEAMPGELLWHLSLPGVVLGRLAATIDDALVLVGSYPQPVDLLGVDLPVDGGPDTYVARITPPETLDWVFRIHSEGQDVPQDVATSPSGRIAVSGTWNLGTLTLGMDASEQQQGVSENERNAYFALFEPDGELVHASFVQSTVDYFGGIYLASTDRIVGVSGFTGNAVAPDGGLHTSAGDRDAFFLTIDMQHRQASFLTWGASQVDYATHVAADALQPGHSYVVGAYSGTVDFGGHVLTSTDGTDVFVLHIDFLGAVDWAVTAGGSGDASPSGIAVDGQGRPYVVGNFDGSFEVPGGPVLETNGNRDVFLFGLDTSGSHRWSRSFGGPGEEIGRGVAAAQGGNVFIVGEFAAQADFGGEAPLQSQGGKDAVVASYDSDGDYRWSVAYGGPADDRVNAITIGPAGVFVAAGIDGEVDVGLPEPVGMPGERTALVLQYAP